jgi:hypothetical protein
MPVKELVRISIGLRTDSQNGWIVTGRAHDAQGEEIRVVDAHTDESHWRRPESVSNSKFDWYSGSHKLLSSFLLILKLARYRPADAVPVLPALTCHQK